MKKIIIKSILKSALVCLGLMLLPLCTMAQTRTGYFLKGNIYRHNLNPALTPENNYFSFPVLGNFNVSTQGNLGYSDLIYKLEGNSKYKQTTFMSPTVSANEFLSNIDDNNNICLNLDMTILAFGFKAFGGFNTFDISLHSRSGMNIPYEMFEFMKAMGNRSYVIEDINARTKNYIDIALGHSRKINDQLTVGAKFKILLGVAYADANFDRVEASMSGDQWLLNAEGSSKIALGGEYTYSSELTKDGHKKIDGYDDAGAGIQGTGFGIDLGATYDLSEVLTEGLTVSASILDLGFISWKTANASVNPDEPYTFDGFDNMGIHSDSDNKNLEDQFEDLQDDLEDFFRLSEDGSNATTGLGATINLGVEYKMPFYNKLSAGFLFTHCFDGVYSWTEGRLSANISPVKWFDFGLSMAANTYGFSTGALANISAGPMNIFFGTDWFFGKTTKQFIPLEDMNGNATFGFNFLF